MDWVRRFRRMSDEPPATPATPDEAVRRLLDGNARFIREVAPDVPAGSTVPPADPAALATLPAAAPPKQSPYCVVLGCSDARAPAELVFEAGPNELFVVRVAGNVLGDECLGSIEYALHNFKDSLHLLVVLGHTGCGAVTAAVDAYLSPAKRGGTAFTRSLRAVVNHALIAVRGGAMALEEFWGPGVAADPGYRDALVEVSVYLNAGMTAYHLREEVRPEEAFGTRAVYGVFDLATCRVIGPDLDPSTDDTSKLAPAPAHPDELVALGRQIAGSPMVARHLSDALRRVRYTGAGPGPRA
jgi:carbonic anhydrase